VGEIVDHEDGNDGGELADLEGGGGLLGGGHLVETSVLAAIAGGLAPPDPRRIFENE
jgi:hypothetical protein